MNRIIFDTEPDMSTPEKVRNILNSTGAFSEQEIEVALEIVRENLEKGSQKSGYNFLLVRGDSGQIAGFACFGPIACTKSGYDLYWIAVHKDFQGMGLGKKLFQETERQVRKLKGAKIYAETSGRRDYLPARKFYQSLGFSKSCRLKDFYAPGDDKLILQKDLN